MNTYHNLDDGYTPLDISAQELAAQQSINDLAWLDTLQQHLTTYLANRVSIQEIEMFRFCLRHIFLCINTLHQLDFSDPTTAPNAAGLTAYHLGWQQLVSLTGTIERLESLCQLLQGALLSLLDGLDMPTHIPAFTSSPAETGADPFCPSQELSPTTHAQWNAAYAALADYLEHWQLCSIRQVSFLDRFARLLPLIPTLPQMDDALAHLLEYSIAIFGDILLDFQAISTGDEEATATLLLDIAQKADQILACADTLLGALPLLVQHHAPGIGLS
jgi:hypothetical protein